MIFIIINVCAYRASNIRIGFLWLLYVALPEQTWHTNIIQRDCALLLQCDHCNENHLDTDEDSSNSDEDADDDGSSNRRDDDDDDDAVECHETKDLKDAADVSNSPLRRPALDSSVPSVANLITLNTAVSEAMAGVVTSVSACGVAGASIANGNLFVFGEHSDAQVF